MKKAWALWAGVLLLAATACTNKPKTETTKGPDQYKVRLQTTKGDVVILVHRDWAPRGADHFYELTKMGFYNNNYFFRALKGFVVQWGMNGDPKINKDWSEIVIPDDPSKVSNKVGTVVFAMAGPASRTTQIFINLGDNSQSLDPQGFTPFGEIVQGMENVQNLFMEYGDGPPNGNGPSQLSLRENGNGYLKDYFPKLDQIKQATVIP